MVGEDDRSGGSGVRRLGAEGREGRRRVQPRGEIVNKRFHRGMPEPVEAEEIHLFHRLFSGPVLKGHAIGSGENAGAIVTEAAVYENLLPRFVAEKREKLNDLFIGWGRPTTDGDVNEAHTQRLGVLAFPCDFFAVLAAQIDNGGDAQQFQLGEAHLFGLCATVEDVGDFPGVGNSREVQFLSVGGLRDRRGGGGCSGLRKKVKRKNKKDGERWERAIHFETDASSVA